LIGLEFDTETEMETGFGQDYPTDGLEEGV